MRTPTSVARVPQLKLAALAVMSCFASAALANPTGGAPVAGTVTMSTPAPNVLEITNSPNSIIHWQGFSINAGEVTRFLQNSASSAVLNRVVTSSPSDILGTLQSNGRVFLINPNGIVFGGGAVVDVAGLVASSLNLSDADFMAGNYRFQPVPGAGSVVNGGFITTHAGGQVYLVGPAVSNGGVITSPQGEVILAAGNSVELMNTGTPGLSVSIAAPDNQALNMGQIFADSGRVGIFAGLINQRGLVSAGTAVVGVDGSIRLQATESTVFAGASNTYAMGALDIDTGDLTVAGYVQTGPQTIDVGRGMIVQNEPGVFTPLFASGGQTINAGFVEVNGVAGGQATIANTGGLQSISTFSTNAAGDGLVVRSAGGTGADISNAFGDQRIQIHNAQRAMIDGATGFAAVGNSGGGMQTFSLSGPGANALVVRSAPGGNAHLTAFGGQTIDAGYVDVTAVGGNANILGIDGDQRINTTAANAAGEGLVVRNLGGGFASIVSDGGEQHIDVRNADRAVVDGALSFAEISNFGGAQTISLTGSGANALALGSPGAQGSSHIVSNAVPGSTQTVSTTGALTVLGGTAPGGSSAGIRSNIANGQQTVRAGSIRLQGGSSGSGNIAVIEAASGSQTIDVGLGGITLMGGAAGASNFVQINQRSTVEAATQTVHSAGPVLVQGGDDGNFNFALIRAFGGHQELAFGNTTLLAGASGIDNFSVILGRDQDITVHGNLALVARGSAGGPNIGGVRIGGIGGGGLGPTPTDLQIHVDGDFSMTAGNVAGTGTLLGNTTNFTGTTDISVHAGGKVSLSGGTAADTYSVIGSRAGNLAGGDISITAGGDIALDSTAPDKASIMRTTDGVTLTAQQITQGPEARIQAGSLNTNTSFGADLDGTNAIGAFSAVNWAAGDVVLHNTSPLLTVTGVQNFSGGLTLQQLGDLWVTGLAFSGVQNVDVSGGLVVQNLPGSFAQLSASGGQTINAGYIEVNATSGGAGIANFGGDQTITTSGANAAGESLALRGSDGGVATITGGGGTQSVLLAGAGANALVMRTSAGPAGPGGATIFGDVQNIVAGNSGEAGSVTLYGPLSQIISGAVPGGTQTISTSGALSLIGSDVTASQFPAGFFAQGIGGLQTVRADSILLRGGAGGNGATISAFNGSQLIEVGAGGVTLLGGTGNSNGSATITASNGSQTIHAGAAGITLAGGANGTNNFAQINVNNGPQQIDAGSILLVGGTEGFNNNALLRSSTGPQTVFADEITLQAGTGGTANFAAIVAPLQDITVHRDVTLTGGSSASSMTSGGGALIGGGANLSTNLVMDVGGNVTLNGGSVANAGSGIGSSSSTLAQNTDITMNVQGNVTLNPGTAANGAASRIGTRPENLGGGEIVVNAGGTIALNGAEPGNAGSVRTRDGVVLTANQVVQGPGAEIQAGMLTVETAQGAQLVGANRVGELAMLNTASGNVAFNNTSALLTVTGIDQVDDGALHLNQVGNLLINGDVTSGAQSINATGDMTITPGASPNVTVQAHGPQTFNAGGSFSLLGGTAWNGYAQTLAHGPVDVTTGADLNVRGGSGLLAYALLYGGDGIRLTVGDELHVDGGSGLLAFARVQTDLWDKIFLDFPNRASGGYFVNGREGVTVQGLDGFFTGLLPARRGRSLIVSYGQ